MKRILFTGGGTAGHVTPNIALIEALAEKGWDCQYAGSKNGIEGRLIQPLGIPYHEIQSGKLRRYFSWQNFIDPFLILLGVFQSLLLCLTIKPHIVFSKGGFVAVPVVFAAWVCRIPVISHESDITPGLANKLCLPFSRMLCVNFAETKRYLASAVAKGRVKVTGSPLRSGLRNTDASRGRQFLGFDDQDPILLVVGGSLGARILNEAIWEDLDHLTGQYQIVHLVGAGHLRSELQGSRYRQFEYLGDEYGDVLAAADLVVSRAGANSLFELISFQKPHILIPLSAAASRGDQLVNARIMSNAGVSLVLQEPELSPETLRGALKTLTEPHWKDAMSAMPHTDAVADITGLIENFAESR